MFFCFIEMFILSSLAKNMDYPPNGLPPNGLAIAALVIFTILGAPLAVTYTIPVISSRIESLGQGQGLAMGIFEFGNCDTTGDCICWKWAIGSVIWRWQFTSLCCRGGVAAFVSALVAIVGLHPQFITRF